MHRNGLFYNFLVLLTSLSRFCSKVDIMSYFHKFSCTQCNKTRLHALSQNEEYVTSSEAACTGTKFLHALQ
jgi:hypothetical protein